MARHTILLFFFLAFCAVALSSVVPASKSSHSVAKNTIRKSAKSASPMKITLARKLKKKVRYDNEQDNAKGYGYFIATRAQVKHLIRKRKDEDDIEDLIREEDPGTETSAGTDPNTNSDSDSDTDPNTQSDSASDTDPDTDTSENSDPNTDSDSTSNSETDSCSETE